MLRRVSFSVVGGLRGSGERGPRPRDVGGIRWVSVRVRHHGPLRLANIRWVSAACARQVNAFPACVPDRQALVECVARSRFVGLYEGVLFGKVGSPGVVVVDVRFRSRWFDAPRRVLRRREVIPGPPYRLSPFRWPMQHSRRVCAALRRRCSAGCQLWWAGHGASTLTSTPFLRTPTRGTQGTMGSPHGAREPASSCRRARGCYAEPSPLRRTERPDTKAGAEPP